MMKEREKDLDIAAKIGQSLLERNELLENDLSSVTEQRTQLEQQVSQLRFNMARKEELLRLYARDAKEREGDSPEGDGVSPEWVHILTEECRELRESNIELHIEAERLKLETADVECKEKELVQQCLEQFTEAKRRLAALRLEAEHRAEENAALQEKLGELGESYEEEASRYQQLLEEHDSLKEQLIEAQYSNTHLTNELSELKERFDDTSIMLKETKEEVQAFKDISMQNSMSGEGAEGQQESIVREIEEVLRKEIIAASTLPERPRSPNHYARQRTMVVMETVRAATLATARRLERLAAESEKNKQMEGVTQKPSLLPLAPLAESSPQQPHTKTTGAQWGTFPPSPVCSEAGSTVSMPEEFIRYRNQQYVAPEKLQIVKPLEGSVTLLKWKLMATPELGGATTFFSDASRPGVHLKGWKAAGIVDGKDAKMTHNLTVDARQKSLSTADLSRLNTTYPPGPSVRRRTSKKASKPVSLGAPGIARTSARSQGVRETEAQDIKENSSTLEENSTLEKSNSLLQQVGSFFGSSLTRLGLSRRSHDPSTSKTEPPPVDKSDLGLAGVL